MADPEIARLLSAIHRTLELIAFLLAVLLVSAVGIGVVVGGGAALLLALNAFVRYVSDRSVPASPN